MHATGPIPLEHSAPTTPNHRPTPPIAVRAAYPADQESSPNSHQADAAVGASSAAPHGSAALANLVANPAMLEAPAQRLNSDALVEQATRASARPMHQASPRDPATAAMDQEGAAPSSPRTATSPARSVLSEGAAAQAEPVSPVCAETPATRESPVARVPPEASTVAAIPAAPEDPARRTAASVPATP